jgi:hypothetical protein
MISRMRFKLDEAESKAFETELEAVVADLAYLWRDGDYVVLSEQADLRLAARAFDHLRNAGSGRTGEGIISARDSLLGQLGIAPLTYRMRSWQFNWEEQDQTFWSYTGVYEQGDRLVNGKGEAFTVKTVERQATPYEDGVLVVERMRDRP